MSGVAGTVTETVNRITGSASRGTVDAQGFQVAHGTTIHRRPGRARAFPRTPPLEQESGSVRDEPIERIMLALGGGGGYCRRTTRRWIEKGRLHGIIVLQ